MEKSSKYKKALIFIFYSLLEMAEAIYMKDSYAKEFDAKVVSVKDGELAVLDRTAFYPNSGGQMNDTGAIARKSDNAEFKVVMVSKSAGEIVHEIKAPEGKQLNPGDEVHGVIDWERRHAMMRYHTAAHVLAAIIEKETGALITGNQLSLEKSRLDFSLENFDREKINEFEQKSNEIIEKALPVRISFISRKEAENEAGLAKLAIGLPPAISEIRVVEIEGFDRQACGGTHVASLSEIKGIEVISAENKGTSNRRIYFRLKN